MRAGRRNKRYLHRAALIAGIGQERVCDRVGVGRGVLQGIRPLIVVDVGKVGIFGGDGLGAVGRVGNWQFEELVRLLAVDGAWRRRIADRTVGVYGAWRAGNACGIVPCQLDLECHRGRCRGLAN